MVLVQIEGCARPCVCSLPLSCPVESDVELLSDLTVSSGNTHRNRVRIKAGRRWFPHLPETMVSHLLPAVSVSICMHAYL